MSAVVTAAAPFLTDERLFSFFTIALSILAGLCVIAFCWRERGAAPADKEEVEAEWGVAPALRLDDRRRAADRG